MSHFITAVLVPSDTADIGAEVARLLAPYAEDMKVEPYLVPLDTGDIQGMRQHYGLSAALPLVSLVPHIEDWTGSAGGLADDGQLYRWSTYNPNSKWDWYVEGGRWDGHFGGRNRAPALEVADGQPPFAIVAPDGAWHEKGNMHWWAIVTDENPDWPQAAKALLARHADCTAVAVDCHI